MTEAKPDMPSCMFHRIAQGIVVDGFEHVTVSDKVRVRLVGVDIEQRLINFTLEQR